MNYCLKCGTTNDSCSDLAPCRVCGALSFSCQSPPRPAAIPWESAGRTGVFNALGAMLSDAFVRPVAYSMNVSKSRDTFMALLYGLVMGSIGILFSALWQSLLPSLAALNWPEFTIPASAATISRHWLIAAPLTILAEMLLTTLYCHSMLWFTRSNKPSFPATFRVISYAQAGQAMQIIPGIGALFSIIWFFLLSVRGLASLHKISVVRVIIALALPLAFFIGILILMALFNAGIQALTSGIIQELLREIR